MTKTSTLALLLGAVLMAACGKAANQVIAGPEPGAGTRVRFFHFGVNAPGVNFFANDTKMAAIGEVAFTAERSEERRVGKECSLTCRSRWSPYH